MEENDKGICSDMGEVNHFASFYNVKMMLVHVGVSLLIVTYKAHISMEEPVVHFANITLEFVLLLNLTTFPWMLLKNFNV